MTHHKNNHQDQPPTMALKRLTLSVLLVLCLLVSIESLKRSTQMSMSHIKDRVAAPLKVTHLLLAGGAARSLSQMTLYPIDAMRTLAQTRDGRTLADVGVGALLRGCTTTSAFALFMGSIQFAVFGACRNIVGPLVASAARAIPSCIVSVPQEVIKQRGRGPARVRHL